MFKSQNKMTCIELVCFDLASLLKLRKLPGLVVKNDQFQVFAVFFTIYTYIHVSKIYFAEGTFGVSWALVQKKRPLKAGFGMFVAC